MVEVFSYFEEVLGQDLERPSALNLAALGISPRNLVVLEAPFTEEEVWAVIKDVPQDKSPGPDGMTAAFYKAQPGW